MHAPPPSLNPDIVLPPITQPPSPSPLPTDEDPTPLSALRSGTFNHLFCKPACSLAFPVDTANNRWEKLRSLVGLITEETRQTDQLISNLRNLIVETDGTTFETHNDTDNTPSAAPTSGSTRNLLGERLPTPSTTPPISPSPYPSPSPSPSARLDRPLRVPATRKTRDASHPRAAVNKTGDMAKGSPGTPKHNGMVSSITGAFDLADPTISDFGLLESLGSPVLDTFTINEGGR